MSRHLTQPEEIDFIERFELPIKMPVQDGNKKDVSILDAKRSEPDLKQDFPDGGGNKKPEHDRPDQ